MSSPQKIADTPAFTALLDAYARWQDFAQRSAHDTSSLCNIPGYNQHAHVSVPTSPSLAFIMACPYIDVQDIPKGERNCSICTDPYNHLSDRATKNDGRVKIAQRLPCGHHLCDNCMYEWLNPSAKSNNTCPFDRRILFPKLPHFLNTEGIQGRLDLVDWFNGARGRQPIGAERDQTAGLKAVLVGRRFEEAIEELEADELKADTLILMRLNNVQEIDAACHRQELQLLEHRLMTLEAIARSMEGHVQISTIQARLQRVKELFARD